MAHILSSVIGEVSDKVKITRALLSVSDKTGIIELAALLSAHNVELLSTGGTAATLRANGLVVKDVSEVTGFPEILDGRVKTLHPAVHGGLLAVRGNAKHDEETRINGIKSIDLVVINLYPFAETIKSGADFSTSVENIDIGGPSMLRSSAKNHNYVAVVTSPNQYNKLIEEIKSNDGSTTLTFRRELAAQAFARSAEYDATIASYFASQVTTGTDDKPVVRAYTPQFHLKYGCNPHQKPSAIYSQSGSKLPFSVISGSPGYINLLDACNAWQLVKELDEALGLPAAASFKHCSPAGAAVGVPLTAAEALAYEIADPSTLSPTALAYVRARNADPMCSFGDFAAVSTIVDVSTAKVFQSEVSDGIVAPGYEPEALEILKKKKKGGFIILLADKDFVPPSVEFREMFGVTFSQKRNDTLFSSDYLKQIVTKSPEAGFPSEAVRDLIVASISIKYTQSNSVGYAINGQMIGVGAGQQSRVDCVKLAGRKVSLWFLRQHPKVQSLPFKSGVKRQDRVNARVRYIEGDITAAELPIWLSNFSETPETLTEADKASFMASLTGVSLASDAFFPFRDSIDHASRYGVSFVAQAGGSVADDEVNRACDEYGMTMAHTGLRLFHH